MELTLEQAKQMMRENNGNLDLSYNEALTRLPDGLTVGDLCLGGTQIADTSNVKSLRNGDYVPGRYLYADGILTHVRAEKRVGDYTLYVGKIKGCNVVSDGEHYAHCGTLRDGIADLAFKRAVDRGAEQYRGMTLDSVVTVDESKTMYRIITGACRQGTEAFVNSLGELKETYTVREIIELTDGQYNAGRFQEFFEKEAIA